MDAKSISVPLNGDRPERQQWLEWLVIEQEYADTKYFEERTKQDDSLRAYDIDSYWVQYMHSYLCRARIWLEAAFELSLMSDPESQEKARNLENLAKQAIAKTSMVAKDFVESAIRVYGELPKPGLPSGNIEVWHPRCEACGEPLDLQKDGWYREAGSKKFYHDGECG